MLRSQYELLSPSFMHRELEMRRNSWQCCRNLLPLCCRRIDPATRPWFSSCETPFPCLTTLTQPSVYLPPLLVFIPSSLHLPFPASQGRTPGRNNPQGPWKIIGWSCYVYEAVLSAITPINFVLFIGIVIRAGTVVWQTCMQSENLVLTGLLRRVRKCPLGFEWYNLESCALYH